MQTCILAKTRKGKEFMYSRHGAIEYPKTWDKKKIETAIKALNEYFNLPDTQTYYAYIIDQWSGVYPEYKLFIYKGSMKLKTI